MNGLFADKKPETKPEANNGNSKKTSSGSNQGSSSFSALKKKLAPPVSLSNSTKVISQPNSILSHHLSTPITPTRPSTNQMIAVKSTPKDVAPAASSSVATPSSFGPSASRTEKPPAATRNDLSLNDGKQKVMFIIQPTANEPQKIFIANTNGNDFASKLNLPIFQKNSQNPIIIASKAATDTTLAKAVVATAAEDTSTITTSGQTSVVVATSSPTTSSSLPVVTPTAISAPQQPPASPAASASSGASSSTEVDLRDSYESPASPATTHELKPAAPTTSIPTKVITTTIVRVEPEELPKASTSKSNIESNNNTITINNNHVGNSANSIKPVPEEQFPINHTRYDKFEKLRTYSRNLSSTRKGYCLLPKK